MSKKPRRSRHRVPILEMRSDPITPEYQAEIDQSVARLERRYRKAEAALQAAERRAEHRRRHIETLAIKQAEAQRIAEHRASEESRLSEYIERIKQAAINSRLASARAEQERKRAEVTAKRDAVTALRKQEAKAAREREQEIARSRSQLELLDAEVGERRRELREIERLMMPGNYAGRSHRAVTARHTHGV